MTVQLSEPTLPLGAAFRLFVLRREGALALAALLALSLVALALRILLMRKFQALGFFYLDDTLFNSDPKSMLDVFSHGARSLSIIYPEVRNSIHPYLWFYFGPAIRLIAKLCVALHLTHLGELELRAALGVFVSPVVSALQTFLLGVVLLVMRFPLRHVLLISAFNVVTFSNLIFGSIPEHFALTSLAITIMMLIAVVSLRNPSVGRLRTWIAVGLLSVGITISNVMALGVMHALSGIFARKQPSLVRCLAVSGAFSAGVALFVLASAHFIGVAMDGPLAPGSVRDNFVERYVRADAFTWQGPGRALAAVGNAVAPSWKNVRTVAATAVPAPYDPALTVPFETSPYPTFTFEPGADSEPRIGWLGLVALIGIAGGALVLARRSRPCRLMAASSAALLALTLVSHILWGDEFFIYSQHWMAASILLLSGLLLLPQRVRPVTEAVFAVFLVAVAWNNVSVLTHLLAAARAAASAA